MTAPAGTGSFGLKAITWGPARRALLKLGAVAVGTTTKHGNYLVELPNGRKVEMGKADDLLGRAHKGRAGALLAKLDEAGLDPLLFLAVLDRLGGAVWIQRPELVDVMQQAIDEINGHVVGPERWRSACQRMQELLATMEPAPEPAPEPEPQPEPAPEPEPTEGRWLIVSEVVALSGVPEEVKRKAASRLRYITSSKQGPFATMPEGETRMIERPTTSAGRWPQVLAYSERAAMEAAEWLSREYAGVPVPLEAPQGPVEVAPPLDQGSVPVEVVEAHAAPQALQAPVYGGPGEALLALCRWHGVEPVFEGFSIDVPATVMRLAESVSER
jgi:hypothetical protein